MHIIISDPGILFREAMARYLKQVYPHARISMTGKDVITVPGDIVIQDHEKNMSGRGACEHIQPASLPAARTMAFSAGEKSVMPFILRGATNKEIAAQLDMRMTSVKLYVRTLCHKLGAANRTQAALMLQKMNMN